MKNIFLIALLACLGAVFTGCSDDDDVLPRVVPETKGTEMVGDTSAYEWVRINGLDWMTSNFKEGEPFYEHRGIYLENEEQTLADYDIYGNLYTYEEAVAMTPAGWRLPTDEDWASLEAAFGMAASDCAKKGWRGNRIGEALQQSVEDGGINLLCAGFCSMAAGHYNNVYFRQVRENGYYWSQTIAPDYEYRAAWYRGIRAYSPLIERELMTINEVDHIGDEEARYLSVRYVRDAR